VKHSQQKAMESNARYEKPVITDYGLHKPLIRDYGSLQQLTGQHQKSPIHLDVPLGSPVPPFSIFS
jgi:hypothetical protein